jgi:hypothetical protein
MKITDLTYDELVKIHEEGLVWEETGFVSNTSLLRLYLGGDRQDIENVFNQANKELAKLCIQTKLLLRVTNSMWSLLYDLETEKIYKEDLDPETLTKLLALLESRNARSNN